MDSDLYPTVEEKPVIAEKKEYSEGMAAIRMSNGKWGYVDNDDNIVIEPEYVSVTPFYHGVAIVLYRGLWCVIGKTGRMLIGEHIYGYNRKDTRYEGIGRMKNVVTGSDRDPDVEYWEDVFVFDTGESIWLGDGESSYSGSDYNSYNRGYISIPKRQSD